MPNSQQEKKSLQDNLFQLIAIFDEDPALWVSLRAVVENPQTKLEVHVPHVSIGEASSIESALLARSAVESSSIETTRRQKHFMARGKKWRFLKVYDRRVVRSQEITANFFVVAFLRLALQKFKHYIVSIGAFELDYDFIPALLYISKRLNALYEQVPESMKFAPLQSLPLDDHILNFDPKYRKILNAYLELEAL